MVQEHGDQLLDLCSRLLTAEIEDSVVFEWCTENERGLVVGVDQFLMMCIGEHR